MPQSTNEKILRYYQIYTNHKPEIEELYPENSENYHYVSSLSVYQTEDDHRIVSITTWTNFMPVVLPVSEFVTIVLLGQSTAKTFIIKQDELLAFLQEYVSVEENPTQYYVLERLDDDRLQDKIIRSAIFLKEVAI
jgi:hypothetical protein